MAKSARKSLSEIETLQRWALAQVKLVSEDVIARKHWIRAADLAAKVDANDIPYVALALMHKCPIWTGDKKLRDGLAANGFSKTLTTAEVRRMIPLG